MGCIRVVCVHSVSEENFWGNYFSHVSAITRSAVVLTAQEYEAYKHTGGQEDTKHTHGPTNTHHTQQHTHTHITPHTNRTSDDHNSNSNSATTTTHNTNKLNNTRTTKTKASASASRTNTTDTHNPNSNNSTRTTNTHAHVHIQHLNNTQHNKRTVQVVNTTAVTTNASHLIHATQIGVQQQQVASKSANTTKHTAQPTVYFVLGNDDITKREAELERFVCVECDL